MDADELLQQLSTKFDLFTGQVLEKLDCIRAEVNKLSESQRKKRGQDADRKRIQRTKARQQRLKNLLALPKNIWYRDDRIKLKYLQYAHVGIHFGLSGDWRTFFEYLAHDWNTGTYQKKPIAKISNRCHWWERGLRHDVTWCDMFGSERGIQPKAANEIKWWDWSSHMLAVVKRMQSLPDWPNVNQEFVRACQVAMGQMAACSDVGTLELCGAEFDPTDHECFEKVPKFKWYTLHVMQAFRRGICKGVDENLELIRLGKTTFLAHCNELQKAGTHMKFLWDLKKGDMAEHQQQCTALSDLGFFDFPESCAIKTKTV